MHTVVVRPSTSLDSWWLLRSGLSLEHAGTRYHWIEAPLQLVIAPLRALGLPRGPSYVVEVDAARAGYVGRNPLSGNLEYWLDPWARGRGTGTRAIAAFLRDWRRTPDRPRAFSIAHRNETSRSALVRALERAGCIEGHDVVVTETRHGWTFTVRPATTP